ncbi:uncharacterized protein LOC121878935 isoform X2 [Homarus americanus]|uniref:uncharacterized protein LOC121878935 isoform X2 n=1 Tax=Homarus americanus TaxID=6706 RepID=UPI001C4901AE|nr:uncharacterized protein LOC121878935 isoform X2 [Homarus americanus]
MPDKCYVTGCISNYRHHDKSLIFHRFPKDEKLREKWVLLCRPQNYINPDTARICNHHFKLSDYERTLKYELLQLPTPKNQIRLKRGTLPTLMLPASEVNASSFTWRLRTDERGRKRLVQESDVACGPDAQEMEGEEQEEPALGTEDLEDITRGRAALLEEKNEREWIAVCKQNNSIKGNVNELHEKLEKEENSEGEEIKPDIKYEEFDPETVYVEDDTGLVSLLDLDSLQQQQQQQSPQQHSPPNDHLTNDNGGGEGIIKQCPDLTEPVPTTSSSVPYSRGDQVNEFHLFGMNVASQLRAMPLRAALEVQLQIQRILTQKRLEIQ